MKANLLVTYDSAHPGKAKEEVKTILEEVGEKVNFEEAEVEGVFLISIGDDAKSIVRGLVDICKTTPENFQYTFQWVPIDKWVSSDINVMEEEMKQIDKKIDPNQSWKLDLNKRKHEGKTTDIIMKLTEHINKTKVDLKNPQKIIRVEIVGKMAGISLLDAEEILNVQKIKKEG